MDTKPFIPGVTKPVPVSQLPELPQDCRDGGGVENVVENIFRKTNSPLKIPGQMRSQGGGHGGGAPPPQDFEDKLKGVG